MAQLNQSQTRNRLLRALPAEAFAALAPHLEPGTAEKGVELFRKDDPIGTAWFLESGVGSLISISAEGHRVESGVFGRDGFAPVQAVLGSDRTPYEGLLQVADDYQQVSADALRAAVGRSAALRDVLLRYVHVLSIQTAYTALANAVHPVDERLARWLLMCHDRIDGDELMLTHEFMSTMLAVRRPSVTTSLHVLEGNGFIRSERGCVTVRDRAGLEEFAADGYGVAEREYERLIGPLR